MGRRPPRLWDISPLVHAYLELFGATLPHTHLLTAVLRAYLDAYGCEVHAYSVLREEWDEAPVLKDHESDIPIDGKSKRQSQPENLITPDGEQPDGVLEEDVKPKEEESPPQDA